MNILLDGYKKPRVLTFECDNCGCIFEANKDEVKNTDSFGMQKDGLPPLNCKCPWCGKTVYGNGEFVFENKIAPRKQY